ncbi:MAG: hypothetical protein Q8R83_07170 [Legionellaceae bacterium]|nr:hypothetical protein [Legionellaceae bacterium]
MFNYLFFDKKENYIINLVTNTMKENPLLDEVARVRCFICQDHYLQIICTSEAVADFIYEVFENMVDDPTWGLRRQENYNLNHPSGWLEGLDLRSSETHFRVMIPMKHRETKAEFSTQKLTVAIQQLRNYDGNFLVPIAMATANLIENVIEARATTP